VGIRRYHAQPECDFTQFAKRSIPSSTLGHCSSKN
jgi:hypothetical protein